MLQSDYIFSFVVNKYLREREREGEGEGEGTKVEGRLYRHPCSQTHLH
jgi:hypothetical protein